jgi:hypothetical protein
VEKDDLFLVVGNEDAEVLILAQGHLGVHSGIVSHCFQVFLQVAVADMRSMVLSLV